MIQGKQFSYKEYRTSHINVSAGLVCENNIYTKTNLHIFDFHVIVRAGFTKYILWDYYQIYTHIEYEQ